MRSRGSLGEWRSSVTMNLLFLNVLMFVAAWIFQRGGVTLSSVLGLHYWQSGKFNPVQAITYMFMHADLAHIFFNMFSLWMFGRILERVIGAKRYLFYYLSCGVGAAIVQEAVWYFTLTDALTLYDAAGNAVMSGSEAMEYAVANGMLSGYLDSMVTIGASGAVFGILLAFGMLFPNMPLYIMFVPTPIKAKWAVIGYGVIELIFGVNGIMGSVAHFAHLGGMLFGLLILLYWRRKGVTGGKIF